MSLILSIKCIIPNKLQKNYIIRIYNRDLDIHMQIENLFTHNYEYVFKLWPSKIGERQVIELQLKEQVGEKIQVRGKASARILYSTAGDLYKFHGNRQENEMFLMKFYVDQFQIESKEEAELKKMNQEMEQNLQKYRREIQNYQEFLYFTNNVIKELNDDVPTNRQAYNPSIKEEMRSEESSGRNFSPEGNSDAQKIQETARASAVRPVSKVFPKIVQENIIKDKQIENPITQKQQTIYNGAKSQKSSQVSVSRSNKARSFLSKYRYLQQENNQQQIYEKSKSDEKRSVSPRINTLINTLKQEIPQQSLDYADKNAEKMQISNQIKQRRQQYLIPQSRKSQGRDMRDQRYLETPILRLSTQLSNPHAKQIQTTSVGQGNAEVKAVQVNYEPNGRISTRSQTGLKDRNTKMNKSIYLQDKMEGLKNSVNDHHISEARVSVHKDREESIIRTINVPQNQKKRSMSNQNDMGRKSSQRIIRKKKTLGNNMMNSSTIDDNERIQDIKRTSKIQKNIINPSVSSPKEGIVTKISIFNIQSLFYTNFKNSNKKCIIQHNHQVYQTQMQENNLKETLWHDRIVVNSISPSEQIIFQVYSLRMNQMNLQGSAIVNISQILTKPDKHNKLYLYFDDIAVGSIKFDIERQQKSLKRLTVSLPEIKGKQPPSAQSEVKPKTIRNAIFPTQVSKVQSYNSNQRFMHPSIKCRQSFPSESQQNVSNDMTSKIRNLKLQRKNRLK